MKIRLDGAFRRQIALCLTVSSMFVATAVPAQEAQGQRRVEEIVVTGSQIKGANIADALAVSVVTAEDIEALGVDSGDELLEFMAEQGQNFFSESENISGGVNSARGDIGAYNLRNLGTGNTLVLLNGRRLVNAASYQTEEVGGSFIPVNTVNSQTLPVTGLERVEVLRDGASAVYGADAVAGVVNYVLKSDFEGLVVRAKYADYEGLPRNDQTFTVEWGRNLNGGRTNVSVFGSFYNRDPVNSQDDPRWADSDFRSRIPEGSPWEGDTAFRNTSANSEFGQYDILPDGTPNINYGLAALDITDADGEWNTYPIGDSNCDWALVNSTVACGAEDGGAIYRYNLNENRDLYSDLDRLNLFAFINHDFGNGLESFTELSAYASDTRTIRQASTRLSAVAKYRVGAENYWNPFGPCGSPNRLPDSVIGSASVPCEGLELLIDNYRWVIPRIVDVDGEVYRLLQGLRGTAGSWDWEAAVSWSRASRDDVTHNRLSNTLIQEALNDSSPEAFNPFNGRVDNNIERALISVYRKNETELTTVDFRMSKNDLFEMPAGPVGIVGGVEWRQESFEDDRDPRLDGTITFTDNDGQTFPIVSDVMNSSPTLDSKGDRDVISAFAELQLPLAANLDMQAAVRYEDFSDVGDTTVGKVAFGWRPRENLLIRGSWSEAFRVPNLITVNESGVARSNTTNDYVFQFVDPDETLDTELPHSYGVQRTAGGSDLLVPEKSTNTSFGAVLDVSPHLTLTADYWTIKKRDTIGLFGEDNHTALDLLLLIEAGNSNCGGVSGNPAVVRDDAAGFSPEALALFDDAGICPVGDAQRVDDVYANLDTREVSGHDYGVYFNYDTPVGTWDLRYVASFLDKYEQVPGSKARALLAARSNGTLPESVVIEGFGNLIRRDTNPRSKQTVRVNWRKGAWGAAVTGTYIGDVFQESLTLDDGSKWILDSMKVWNASVDYTFRAFGDTEARVRLGSLNVTDKRAPLADDSFGYNGDMHRDLPRSWYLDVRLDF
ncbi:MAG: TonB-dependent receptor [Woeseiaceae bacterium]|nr:TonB-dependent receptor [Woeseiaceae bacterium]